MAPHDGDFRVYSASEAAGLVADRGFEVPRTRRVGLWAFLADAIRRAAGENVPENQPLGASPRFTEEPAASAVRLMTVNSHLPLASSQDLPAVRSAAGARTLTTQQHAADGVVGRR